MGRRKFALSICLILSVVIGFSGLSSCGGGGGPSSSGDQVIITPPGNRAPVSTATFENIALTLEVGRPFRWGSDNLGNYFSDPDGDRLSYSAMSSDRSVAAATVSEPGPVAIVQAEGGGSATITVTARDPGGLTARQQFRVTVSARTSPNRAPTIRTRIPSVELRVGGSWTFQNTSSRFSDPDGDRLTITAQPIGLNSSFVTATLSGEQLVVRAVRQLPSNTLFLSTSVRVTARDPGGLTVSQTFNVTVRRSQT